MVGGQVLKQDGRLLHPGLTTLKAGLLRSAARLMDDLGDMA
jgi:hypothetical protein